MKEVTKKPSAARSHPYARPPAPASSHLASPQPEQHLNTACTFRGCPLVAHAQRCSQAVAKHHHLPDGSIPVNYKGTLAYVRHVQGRWSMAACKPVGINPREQSSIKAGVPNNQMLSPPSVTRTPMTNQAPTMMPVQPPLSGTHPYSMSRQLSGHSGDSTGVQHGTVKGVGVPQMSRQQTVPTQSPQDDALIGTGAHKTRSMQVQFYRQPANIHHMIPQPQHSEHISQKQGAPQHFYSPPSPLISQAHQLSSPYPSAADIMASLKRINNEAEVAPFRQKGMQSVPAPQQWTFGFKQFTSPPPLQQPATAQHLTTPVPQPQHSTMLAAPPFFSNPYTAAPAFKPTRAPAPLSLPAPAARPTASVPKPTPHPKKKAMEEEPHVTTAKPTSLLELTTPNRRITPIPPPIPATTQVKAQEQVQQQLQPAEQQVKQASVEASQQHESTPPAEVGRELLAATPAPVAESPVPQVTPVWMPVQTVEDIHKRRVTEWWSTNPYGDQSQLYLPGSGVPPGVKPCRRAECVYCARISGVRAEGLDCVTVRGRRNMDDGKGWHERSAIIMDEA